MYSNEVLHSGFCILPDVVSAEAIDHLLDGIAAAQPYRSRAGIRHALRYPAVAAFAARLELINLAREILGPDALPFRATVFDKSPQSNWLVMWHQDTALPIREKADTAGWGPWSVKDGVTYAHAPAAALQRVLALRVHLDDSEADNGPLRILPGTHERGVLDNDTIHHLAKTVVPVECLVPKAGMIAIRPLAVHASSKSKSNKPRRVLHIEYAASRITLDGLELATA
jgi:ectoine hydroxylase-related dioxygenase (phytanoyl-CoA dioxygenase family)